MTACPPVPARGGLHGHLQLTCAIDEQGRSHLKRQSFSTPFHLSKPSYDNGVLVVNVANPTAGLFQGDSTRSEVCVESGARLLLTTPSATRVHDTQEGWSRTTQEFTVEPHGWLEVLPELFIPQAGARHRQRTSINVSSSGELMFLEILAPGRVASGEIFAFDELDWQTEIHLCGQLIVRERFILSPKNGSLRPLLAFSAHPYVATLFIITEQLDPSSACWHEIDALHSEKLWIGHSRLVAGGWAIKILSTGSQCLREAIAKIREQIHQSAAWPMPPTRKL